MMTSLNILYWLLIAGNALVHLSKHKIGYETSLGFSLNRVLY